MKRLLLICLALSTAIVLAGCLFSKKTAKPKEDPPIAAGVEASLKQRWVEKRISELTASGVAPAAAKAQAEEEFRVRYSYTGAAQK
jgi:hypothetical protein